MRLTMAIAVVGLGGAIACATDATTSPANTSTRSGARTSTLLDQPITVVPLQRSTPLSSAQTASARIGVLGGQISLPDAGLTVVVPPLAVVTPVTITVTALAGSDVAYEFSPHGLAFLAPLTTTQSLTGTAAATGGTVDPLSLFVGYFPDSSQITTVTELLNVQLNVSAQTSTVLLSHFSGYMWSGGDAGDTLSASAVRRAPNGGRIPRLVRP